MEQSNCNENDFPLESLLRIFCTSQEGGRNLYLDYFARFKLIHRWLEPIAIPSCTPNKLHWYESSYEIQELAKIIGCSQTVIHRTLRKIYYE